MRVVEKVDWRNMLFNIRSSFQHADILQGSLKQDLHKLSGVLILQLRVIINVQVKVGSVIVIVIIKRELILQLIFKHRAISPAPGC